MKVSYGVQSLVKQSMHFSRTVRVWLYCMHWVYAFVIAILYAYGIHVVLEHVEYNVLSSHCFIHYR